MFLWRFTRRASDGKDYSGYLILDDNDHRSGLVSAVPLATEPEVVEYGELQICSCPKRHSGIGEGTVEIWLDSFGRVQKNYMNVKDAVFPCEKPVDAKNPNQ